MQPSFESPVLSPFFAIKDIVDVGPLTWADIDGDGDLDAVGVYGGLKPYIVTYKTEFFWLYIFTNKGSKCSPLYERLDRRRVATVPKGIQGI